MMTREDRQREIAYRLYEARVKNGIHNKSAEDDWHYAKRMVGWNDRMIVESTDFRIYTKTPWKKPEVSFSQAISHAFSSFTERDLQDGIV
jgi:hypothetical protein